jgi:hypothetical protein
VSLQPTAFAQGIASALTAGELNVMVQSCANLAALRSFIGVYGQLIFLQGAVTANDGGQGFYTFVQGAATDNGTTVVVPAGVFPPSYWQQVPFNQAGTGGSTLTAQRLVANGAIASSLATGALSYGTLSYTDTNLIFSGQASVNGYAQTILQNTSGGATASADYIVSNNLGTATTYYGDFGMNSSTFSGTGALNAPNAVYLSSTTADLVIGTQTANPVHFLAGGAATDAMTITINNLVQLNSVALPTLSAAPGSPITGQIYYDTALGYPRIYNGTTWLNFRLS